MNKSTYGERLFEDYLSSQVISFEREPALPGIAQLIDFVIEHPVQGKILLEVKDIENQLRIPAGSVGTFDPYEPIREHIEEGTRKFKSTSEYTCALILAATPGSFVDLDSPHIVLGAMYGDYGFRIPFNPKLGHLDRTQMTQEFIVGNGKMVRKSRVQNTRIAALITIHDFKLWHCAMRKYLNTENGRSREERFADIWNGEAGLPDEEASAVGVTVWENAAATKKLPTDLFRGEMDAWWQVTNGDQSLTFIGEMRRSLRIDET